MSKRQASVDCGRCPGTARGVSVDARGCAADRDGDGIVDVADRCPGTAAGVTVNDVGCPVAAQVQLPVVRFAYKSDQLTDASVVALDAAAAVIAGRPDLTVEIAGYTDNIGGATYNRDLSAQRAQQVLEYLVARGVDRKRLRAVGYGQADPVASNATEAGRAENRRVVLRVVDAKHDGDGDGVPDDIDRCPSSSRGIPVDRHGCKVTGGAITLPVVRFAYKSGALTADSKQVLDRAAAALAGRADLLVEVAGYTDNVGGAVYNQRLSQQRAEHVLEYLVSRGVSRSNLRAVGYGQRDPVADNATEQGRAANRRVVLRFLDR